MQVQRTTRTTRDPALRTGTTLVTVQTSGAAQILHLSAKMAERLDLGHGVPESVMCFCVQGRQRGRHLPGLGTKTSHRLALATLRSAPPEAARRSSRAALRALRARSASLSSLQAERASRLHCAARRLALGSLRSVPPGASQSPPALVCGHTWSQARSVRFSCFGCAARGLAPASLRSVPPGATQPPPALRARGRCPHTRLDSAPHRPP